MPQNAGRGADGTGGGEYLSAGLGALSLSRPEIRERLEAYIGELLLFNPAYGLIAAHDRDEIIIRHILDSLAPWKRLACEAASFAEHGHRAAIADVGSGAGLPGIPLAVVMENARFTLIEKMRRRVQFLLNAKALLRLDTMDVNENEAARAAQNAAQGGARFDMAVCRGFSAITGEVIKLFSGLLNTGGKMVFYKGRREKIDAELAQCGEAAHNAVVVQYAAPFLREERHLVIIQRDAAG
jgi:16S rRNA (guanine527-N7)-methyltransferase